MKTIRISAVLALCATSIFSSCDDEKESAPKPSVVEFEDDTILIPENTEKKTVKILFDHPATQNGEIEVLVSGDHPDTYMLEPAPIDDHITFAVTKGQSSVSIDVFSIDNDDLDGDKGVSFYIHDVSDGLTVGANRALLVGLMDDEAPAAALFEITGGHTREDNGEFTVSVSLSREAAGEGTIQITPELVDVAYGTHFITAPALVNGKITLPVEQGDDHVSFKVIPVNDQLFNGSHYITWFITETTGAVSKGASLTYELTINDDELAGRRKGYEIFAGNWQYKRNYIYDEVTGLLKKITWEKQTPGLSTGYYEYVYDDQSRVSKVLEPGSRETRYTWTEGRITKSEEFTNGERTKFTIYAYDGNQIVESAIHSRQPDGEFPLTMDITYQYHEDGNIQRKLVFAPDGNNGYTLMSTEKYLSYNNAPNPFPMVEILPVGTVQAKLPSNYFLDEGGSTMFYEFAYEYDVNGNPTRRDAFTATGSEVAIYHYY